MTTPFGTREDALGVGAGNAGHRIATTNIGNGYASGCHATILHTRLARLLHGHRLGRTAGIDGKNATGTRKKVPSETLDKGKSDVLIGGDGALNSIVTVNFGAKTATRALLNAGFLTVAPDCKPATTRDGRGHGLTSAVHSHQSHSPFQEDVLAPWKARTFRWHCAPQRAWRSYACNA